MIVPSISRKTMNYPLQQYGLRLCFLWTVPIEHAEHRRFGTTREEALPRLAPGWSSR